MGWGGYGWGGFREYVPVATKLAKAVRHAAQVAKKAGRRPAPVKIEGRKIATTFWGQAWCDNLACYSDYANRLPRGATYVRNGSVVDLIIEPRRIDAIVAGSDPYRVSIQVDALPRAAWKKLKQDCAASIESLLDLLAGRLSDGVMRRLTQQQGGLFPSPREITMKCSCPDGSYCCKHLAAVMYGVGARLDSQPELLFLLRGVDHQELASQAVAEGNLAKELSTPSDNALAGEDLGAIFGIELERAAEAASPRRASTRKKASPQRKKASPQRTKAPPAATGTKSVPKPRTANQPATRKAATKKSKAK